MKRLLSLIVLGILLISVIVFVGNTQLVRAASVNVPGDYSTIQAAIDAANPGDTINVAAGNYPEQITINKSLDLIGEGEATTTILAPSTRTGTVTQGTIVHDFIVAAYATSGTIDVRIEGFTIDANTQNKVASAAQFDGVFFGNVTDTSGTVAGIFSCSIHNFADSPAYEGFGVVVYGDSLLTVNDNDISDYTRDGISINRYGGSGSNPDVTISGNTITGSPTALNGINIGTVTAGTVTGNTITGNTRSGPWAGGGIVVWSSTGVTIQNNHVDNNFYGIDLEPDTSGVHISGNTLEDNIKRAISLNGADNNFVSGNTITGPVAGTDDVAIGLANGATGNMIGGNTAPDGNIITMATSGTGNLYAIYMQADVGAGSNTLKYNTINGGKRGVQFDGPPGITGTTTIANNIISGQEFGGITAYNNGDLTIIDNTLINTVRPIEFFGPVNIIVTGNTINGGAYSGINLGSFTGTADISSNTIHGITANNGIWAQTSGAGLTIRENTIYDINDIEGSSRGIQIDASADGADIDDNEIYNIITGFSGIVIDTGATGVKINNNYIHDNKQGVVANEQTAEFTGNNIINNRWGIDLNKDGATFVLRNNNIAYNNINPADSYGLSVWAGVADAEDNYWGSAVLSTIQSSISGAIDFEPYYVDSAKTILSSGTPTTVYVDDAYVDGNAGGHIFGYNAFNKIQDGINEVATGGAVNVAAGTYTATSLASIVIEKPLTLQGAGIDQTIIDAGIWGTSSEGWSKGIHVKSNDVFIKDLTIQGFEGDGSTTGGYGIVFRDWDHDTLAEGLIDYHGGGVENVKIMDCYSSLYSISFDDIVIRNNIIENSLSDGMYIAKDSNNVLIEGNTVTNSGDQGIWVGISWDGEGPSNNCIIRNNIVDGAREAGIIFDQSTNCIIEGNTVTNIQGAGWSFGAISVKDGSDDVTIINNIVYNNPTLGIGIDGSSSNINIYNNRIFGNTDFEMKSISSPVNAINNYWGTHVKATIQSRISGDIDFEPYYVDSGMTILSNTPYTISVEAGSGGSISPSGASSVIYGSYLSFTITPSTGYYIVDVLVDGVSVGAVTSYTFANVQDAHTISASFAINTYTITASVGSGGSVSPSGATNVNFNGNQTYTITPNTGYSIVNVLVDGASKGAITSYAFTNVQADHTISATFAINTFDITTSAGSGGSISPSGTVSVSYGSDQAFTITPNTGYHVVDVIVDDISVGATTNYTFTNVLSNHTITASFAINTFSITATAGAQGSISPSGNVSVTYGNSQTFTISANTGYHIANVLVDSVSQGAISSFTFNSVNAAHTISASFAINTYTISASAGANGAISPSGTVSANYGSDQAFTITPSTGYHVADVIVDGVSQGAITTYTFRGITGAHTITASFTRPQLSVSISPSSATMDVGQSQTFTASASGGSGTYSSYQWSLNGVAVSGATASTYTFTPNTAGSTSVSVTVTDSDGAQAKSNSATVTVSTSATNTITVTGGSASVDHTSTTGVSVSVSGSSVQDGTVLNITSENYGATQPSDTGALQINVNAIAFYDVLVSSSTQIGSDAMVVISFTNPAFTAQDNFMSYWNGNSWVTVASYFTAPHTITGTFPASALTGTRIVVGKATDLTTYTITAQAGSGGSISPSGAVSISDGSAMLFTITPDTGYYIADVLVDGVSVGAVTSYTFSSVTGAHTIAVSFAITPSGVPPGYIAGAVLVVLAASFLVFLFVARKRQKKRL